jgi:tRNA(Arg) A34 adenosine deaminase TadA
MNTFVLADLDQQFEPPPIEVAALQPEELPGIEIGLIDLRADEAIEFADQRREIDAGQFVFSIHSGAREAPGKGVLIARNPEAMGAGVLSPPVIDETHLRRTFELAREAAASGNTPFGSLLVREGEVIAESRNTTRTEEDITAHPELKLARWAARELDDDGRGDVTMYTSTEPCPMCAGAMAIAGLGRVVYSVDGATAAEFAPGDGSPPSSDLLDRESDIEVIGPELESEGRAVHRECWEEGDRPETGRGPAASERIADAIAGLTRSVARCLVE